MSKASQQQQPMTSRDRTTPAPARPKQPGKGDGNGNGVKPGPHREAATQASAEDVDEFAIVPSESAEDDFFARGEANSSLAPAAMDVAVPDLDDPPESEPLTPAQLQRRMRLRRIVGVVVGAAGMLTAVVGAKALAAPPARVTASDGGLNVPHQVVPSIAMAGQDQPAAAKTTPSEKVAAADPGAAPAVETAPVGDNPAQQEGSGDPSAQPGAETAAGATAATAPTRRLPVIDVEIPPTADPTTDRQWESAAKNLASQDFKGADSAFAELGKRGDPATREAARLARAAWWTANGRQSEVKPVLADLAANATNPSVRQQARELLRAN
jgi:hypothetical protein